jgi:hypothetical protein
MIQTQSQNNEISQIGYEVWWKVGYEVKDKVWWKVWYKVGDEVRKKVVNKVRRKLLK